MPLAQGATGAVPVSIGHEVGVVRQTMMPMLMLMLICVASRDSECYVVFRGRIQDVSIAFDLQLPTASGVFAGASMNMNAFKQDVCWRWHRNDRTACGVANPALQILLL